MRLLFYFIASVFLLISSLSSAADQKDHQIFLCDDGHGHRDLADSNKSGKCTNLNLPSDSNVAPTGTVSVIGFEDMTCGAWAKSASSEYGRSMYLAWFRGFLSGYNRYNLNSQISYLSAPSSATLTLYVDKYCRENPLNMFTEAAPHLVDEIAPKPQPQPLPPLPRLPPTTNKK